MFYERLNELKEVVEKSVYTTRLGEVDQSDALDMAHFLLEQTSKVGGIAYLIGNGGSAAIASHFSTDLLRTLELAAATLSEASTLSCFGNDFGYEHVYEMPLKRNLRAQDLLIAISSSGQSENILAAMRVAKEKKVTTLTFSGFDETNPLRKMGDLNFWLNSHDYGLVETGHFFQLHTIVDTYKGCKKKSNRLATSGL